MTEEKNEMRPVPQDAAAPATPAEPDGRDGRDGRRPADGGEVARSTRRWGFLPRRGPGAIAAAVPLVGVLLVAVLMVLLFVRDYEALSPLDEMQHIDYVYHLLDGDLVQLGDTLDPATERAVACRGIDVDYQPPPCGGPYATTDFPNAGYNTAYIHAPVYYAVTAAWFWVAQRVAVPADDVFLMRSSGIFWTVLALVLMWAMMRALQLSRLQRIAGCLLVLAAPPVVLALGTVTNDATALAVGAAVTLAVVRWDQGRAPLWAVAMICAVGVLLKATNIGVVGLAVAYVAIRAYQRHRAASPGARPRLRGVAWFVAAVVGGTAAPTVAWLLYQADAARISSSELPQNQTFLVGIFSPSWLFEELPNFLLPLAPAFPAPLRGGLMVAVGNVVSVAVVVLFVLGVAARHRREDVGALAGAAAVALLGLGPLLVLVNWFTSDLHFDIPVRYGLSLVPAVIAVGVSAARGPRQEGVLAGFAALCCLTVLGHLALA